MAFLPVSVIPQNKMRGDNIRSSVAGADICTVCFHENGVKRVVWNGGEGVAFGAVPAIMLPLW